MQRFLRELEAQLAAMAPAERGAVLQMARALIGAVGPLRRALTFSRMALLEAAGSAAVGLGEPERFLERLRTKAISTGRHVAELVAAL